MRDVFRRSLRRLSPPERQHPDAGARRLPAGTAARSAAMEAANGDAAVSICERHGDPVHLLITDIVMPGMSGRELVDRLAALRPGIRALYMSGYTDRAIVHQQVMDEKTPLIQKPFAPHALVKKVREVLDKSKLSSAPAPLYGRPASTLD